MRVHIVLKSRDEASMRRVVEHVGLTNVNEARAKFFEYSLVSADATPEALVLLRECPEVEAVELDRVKTISDGSK